MNLQAPCGMNNVLNELQSTLRQQGFGIVEVKAIQWGWQLLIEKQSESGVIRLYSSKASNTGWRLDFSLLLRGKQVSWFREIEGMQSTIAMNARSCVAKKKQIFSKSKQSGAIWVNEKQGAVIHGKYPVVGADEAGKGDYFGPLVVAATLLESQQQEKLLCRLGVGDSKLFSDDQILFLAKEMKKLDVKVSVSMLFPRRYNENYSQVPNLNRLLSTLHADNVAFLIGDEKVQVVILDQFSSLASMRNYFQRSMLSYPYHFETHAESKFVAVAAASVFARAKFVKYFKLVKQWTGLHLPKGGSSSSVVRAGRDIVRKKGVRFLNRVAKEHFKTHLRCIGAMHKGR